MQSRVHRKLHREERLREWTRTAPLDIHLVRVTFASVGEAPRDSSDLHQMIPLLVSTGGTTSCLSSLLIFLRSGQGRRFMRASAVFQKAK